MENETSNAPGPFQDARLPGAQHVEDDADEHVPAIEVLLTKNKYPHTRTFDNFWRIHEPLLPDKLPFPVQSTFLGTIKLHGANCTIIFSDNDYDHLVLQSRNTVLTQKKDNKGTVKFLSAKPLSALAREVMRIHGSSTFTELMIAGEMCGRGVNKGVAISSMDPFFVVFNIRINGTTWLDMRKYSTIHIPSERVFNIMNWPSHSLSVDFSSPSSVESFRSQLDALVQAIDEDCPFASTFSDKSGKPYQGKGEGLVWTLLPDPASSQQNSEMFNFKTKSSSFDTVVRIASIPPVPNDATGLLRAKQFVEYALTERRFEQGLEWLEEMHGIPDTSLEKRFVKQWTDWVIEDMVREEGHVMDEMRAHESHVRKVSFPIARDWFFSRIAPSTTIS